jgi:hypothetical protein
MDSEHSNTGRSIRRISGLVATAVLTLGMVALTPVPAGAATSPPHAPVGLWL